MPFRAGIAGLVGPRTEGWVEIIPDISMRHLAARCRRRRWLKQVHFSFGATFEQHALFRDYFRGINFS
jgi:hypothetical protein